MSTEKATQTHILEYYGHGGRYRLARMNSGGVRSKYTNKFGATKERFFKFNNWPGMSDIIGIEKGTGRWIAIEVKDVNKNPTELQQRFLDEIKEFGGIAIVARSLDDVIAVLGTPFIN